ncbi:MAG: hypothetical protein ACRENE_05800, partial [Polyangiaceae bacterium]
GLRWVTVTTAVGEALVLVAVLIFLALRWLSRPTGGSRRLGPLPSLALFAGTLAGSYSWSDPSPTLQIDTINEQSLVASCVDQAVCSSLGVPASIRGLFHASAWIHMRILGALGGLGIPESFFFVHALNAASVVLVAHAVARHAGRGVAAFAALACAVGSFVVADPMTLNSSLAVPFAGALLLVVTIEVVDRPTPGAMILLGLVAGVAANVQLAGVLAGASIVWTAWLVRGRRVRFLALGLAAFAAATFAVAPAAWIANGRWALAGVTRIAATVHEMDPLRATPGTVTFLELLAVALLVGRSRRRSAGPLAAAGTSLALPVLGVEVLLSTVPGIVVDARSTSIAMPAVATLVAIAATALVRFVAGVPRPAGQTAMVYVAGLGAGLVTVVATRPSSALGPQVAERSALVPDVTFADVEHVAAEFAKLHWSYAHVYRSLRSPVAGDVLSAMGALAPNYPMGPDGNDRGDAYFLKVDVGGLPSELPPGWTLLRRHGTSASLFILAQAALKWDTFEACDQETGACSPSGLRVGEYEKPVCPSCVKGMPAGGRTHATRLELRIPVLPAPPGTRWGLRMPRAANFCEGRILGVDGRDAEVSADGRTAEWTAPADPAAPGTARILWELASPTCRDFAYRGMPPFFFEGETKTVEALEDLVVR